MRKTFSKYLSYKKDNVDLLLFLLKQLVKDHTFYQRTKGRAEAVNIQIQERDLIERARRINITSVKVKTSLTMDHGG